MLTDRADLRRLHGPPAPSPSPRYLRPVRFLHGLGVMGVMFLFAFGLPALLGGL